MNAVKSVVTVTGGTFQNNKAYSGGALNALTGSEVTINGTTFISNESTHENTDSNTLIGGGAVRTDTGKLTMSAVVMDGNKSCYYGGTVLASGANVIINANSVVKNSVGTTGSALYLRSSSEVSIENTEISNNESTNGAVYINSGTLNMTNVTATNNNALNGSVLFISGSTKAKIEECNWSGNTAQYGGAIHLNNAFVEIIGGEMKGNTANIGGVAYNKNGTIQINGVTFTENTATKDSDGKNGNGGAVSLAGGTLISSDESTFIGNSAENHGGAVYVAYSTNEDSSKNPGVLVMTGGTFENNVASVAGGAVSARTACEVTLTSTILKGNSALSAVSSEGGGAIFANDNSVTLSSVVLDGNSTSYYGGAVTALNATVNMNSNTQIKNSVGITGNAINLRGTGNCTLTDVSITDNVADNGSGVVYITGSGSLNITRLTATGNQNNNGGVIYSSGSATISITDSTVTGNTALISGGAIDHRSSGKLTVDNTTISNNASGLVGGAISARGKGTVEIKNSTLENNEAQAVKTDSSLICRGGGAVYVSTDSNVVITSSSFNGNNAEGTQDTGTMTDAGGAILVDGGSLTVSETSFTGNTANNGGAIGTSKATDTAIYAESCTFTSNASNKNGGAVYIQNGVINDVDTIVLKDCTFKDNAATAASGASVYIRTSSSATLINVDCSGGTWSWKGEIYATGGARLTLQGTVSVEEASDIYITGSGTSAIVNYTTDAEKSAWESSITTASSATVTYNQI